MSRASLAELEPGANFIRRHIGPSEAETREMLRNVGAKSLEDFIAKVVPEKIRLARPLDLPTAKAERTTLSYLRKLADRNEVFTSMIGMGYYGTVTPKVILRNVLENPGWYTAYTPYQAEVSQGRLEALLNFQQVVVDLTGSAQPQRLHSHRVAGAKERPHVVEAANIVQKHGNRQAANVIVSRRGLGHLIRDAVHLHYHTV